MMGRDFMVNAWVDQDDVLDELDTDDLIRELKTRKDYERKAAADPELSAVLGLLCSWDLERLTAAVIAGDGARALDILRPLFVPQHHAPSREIYEALSRDPKTGRPLIA